MVEKSEDWFSRVEGGGERPPAPNMVPTYTPSSVKHAAQEAETRMLRSGTSYSDAGRVYEAQRDLGMREAVSRMSKIAEQTPPLSSELISKSGEYFQHQDRVLNADPFTKKSFYGGSSFPGLADGGMPIYTDPLNSPTRFGIPTWHDGMSDEEETEFFEMARQWCKYQDKHHPIVPTCFRIYARYPFVGLDIQCPDPAVEAEYKSVFFDQLEYEDLLPKAALAHWVQGEAPMLGRYNQEYAGWVEEKILNPDDIRVVHWPGPDTEKEAFFWVPPEPMIRMFEDADLNDPVYEHYLNTFGMEKIQEWQEGKWSELPDDVFNLLRHDQDIGGKRGFPILMRAFFILMQEEKLNQAMNAVADRMYTPFIVAKLGSQNLLQGQYPWMPTKQDLDRMQAHIEMVMASKYRVMVYHSGIEFENPFSGQTIPNLTEDFTRATESILGVFGISRDLIFGGSAGTYAAGALSAEIMMQNLAAAQKMWATWWIRDRARKMAEDRGYYTVERKGLTYTKPVERVFETDPRTGEERVRDRRILMLPSIRMETMDWRDHENTLKNLLDIRLRLDAPIPNQYFVSLADPTLNLETSREQYAEEKISDYEMRQSLGPADQAQSGLPGGGGGSGGGRDPSQLPTLPRPGGGQGGPGGPPGDPNGLNPNGPAGMQDQLGQSGNRPASSDEQRANMPARMSSLQSIKENVTLIRKAITGVFKKANPTEPPPILFVDPEDKNDVPPGYKKGLWDDALSVEPDRQAEYDQRFTGFTPEKTAAYSDGYRRHQGEPTEREHKRVNSYAQDHMFTTFRTYGNQRGTLYYMPKSRGATVAMRKTT